MPRRVLRSAELNLLTVPPGKPGKYGSRSFARASANLWNSLRSFWKEEFYSDKNSTKKYSAGIIDMIKLKNIYNTYTYIPIYIQLNTHIYM